MVSVRVDTEGLLLGIGTTTGGLERLAHVVLLHLLGKTAMVEALGGVGLLEAIDRYFVTVDGGF